MTADATAHEPASSSGLAEVLSGFRPRTDTEAADLQRTQSLLSSGDPWRRSTPLHLTASALVVHPPTGRVLLRWHERQRAWLQVGGHADPGETDPVAIAIREGAEETGLTDLVPWPDRRLVHLAIVSVRANQHEPAHEHADLRFMLATDAPAAIRPETPTAELRWLSIPEAEALTSSPTMRVAIARAAPLLCSS